MPRPRSSHESYPSPPGRQKFKWQTARAHYSFQKWVRGKRLVSADACLETRGITAALQHGADIIICGRAADPSPVVAAAWYWHDWHDTDFDSLAGALVAGTSSALISEKAVVAESGGDVAARHYWRIWERGFTDYIREKVVDIPFFNCIRGLSKIRSVD
jgi:hypothetical protein